ncbi:hypothetical protein QCA50_008812 [Cerrena zonata]|uniref:Uncharacterized protein n=1 Tax=Cerrena zonata TaxID=2478898 RepID=A0AAW0G2N1_9APHY
MASSSALQELFDAMEISKSASYLLLPPTIVTLYDMFLRSSEEGTTQSSEGIVLCCKILWARLSNFPLQLIRQARCTCVSFTWISTLAGPAIFTTTINIILSLRLYALYSQSRIVAALLSTLVFAEFVLETYSCIAASVGTTRLDPPLGLPWTGCLFVPQTSSGARDTLLAWVSCLVVSMTFFLLMVYKFIIMIAWRKNDSRFIQTSNNDQSPAATLLDIFVRDGTLYFFLIFCTVLLTTVFNNVTPLKQNVMVPFSWMIAIYSLAGSGLILNLRTAARTTEGILSFSTATTHMSELRVAHSETINSTTIGSSAVDFELETYSSE